MPVIRQLGTRSLSGGLIRERDSMRYLVHRGTGTIIDPSDDVVIVDIDDDNLEEEDILELAKCLPAWNKAIVLRSDECPIRLSDEVIFTELNDYVYDLEESGYSDDYRYCLANPHTWALIRDAIMNDDPLWNEYSDTWTNAVLTVAEHHRDRNGVAE